MGEYIAEYRKQHGLSQRQFASNAGLSNSYISLLENNKNPKTGQPIIPGIEQIRKIANAMGLTVQELILSVDDMPVNLTEIAKPQVLSPAYPRHHIREVVSDKAIRIVTRIHSETYELLCAIAEERGTTLDEALDQVLYDATQSWLEEHA